MLPGFPFTYDYNYVLSVHVSNSNRWHIPIATITKTSSLIKMFHIIGKGCLTLYIVTKNNVLVAHFLYVILLIGAPRWTESIFFVHSRLYCFYLKQMIVSCWWTLYFSNWDFFSKFDKLKPENLLFFTIYFKWCI